MSGRFPLEFTDDEELFGFGAVESPTGERVLIARLPSGLCALKAWAEDGTTEYIVCNEQLEPLYVAAKTLEDLRQRFARRSGRQTLH